MTPSRPLVLVVEDDYEIATLVAEILESEGFDVRTARNGRKGLDLLASGDFGAVVLDLMMPELDGFGFLAGWRERPEPRPPVLAMSAFDAYLPAAVEQGATAALKKPFELDVLVSAVGDLVERTGAPPPLPPPAAPDERARLLSILSLRLDQPAPTEAMDAFVKRVARLFDVEICLVSIVTRDRQYWHAFCGLPADLEAARGSPRDESFCSHAVVARTALVVQDAAKNPFFADNAFVRRQQLRFYAGVPLTNRLGEVLGTLCLIDPRPRTFSSFDLELLSVLAKRVVAELEWRERRQRPGTPDSAFRYLGWIDEELDVLGREAFVQGLQVSSLRAAEQRRPLSLAVVAVPPERVVTAAEALKEAFPAALIGRLGRARLGLVECGGASEDARERASRTLGPGAEVVTVSVPRIAGGVERFLHDAEASVGNGFDAGL